MKSLDIAIKKLNQEDLSFILVKEGVVLKKSKDSGIMPILSVYLEGVSLLEGGAVADKVIGRAAAVLLREGKISRLYAKLISKDALKMLQDAGVEIKYDELVETILNRDKTDRCPMEKLAQGEESGTVLAKKICDFIGLQYEN